jgi:hypothetical protein
MLSKLFIFLIKIYQNSIGLVLPKSCRFYPSCSVYSIQAVEEFGFLKGSFKSIKRLLKCHPFHPGGYDPVR